MVKIKRKVEMKASELIEWGFENNVKNRRFMPNQSNYKPVVFDSDGYVEFSHDYAYEEGTYTVEIEE